MDFDYVKNVILQDGILKDKENRSIILERRKLFTYYNTYNFNARMFTVFALGAIGLSISKRHTNRSIYTLSALACTAGSVSFGIMRNRSKKHIMEELECSDEKDFKNKNEFYRTSIINVSNYYNKNKFI